MDSLLESETPRRRGRQRSTKVQEAVLSATWKLLEKHRLTEISADAIAQKPKVSKATLYKWWPNKSLIAVEAFEAKMHSFVAMPDTGSAREDFLEHLCATIDFYKSWSGDLICQFIAEGQRSPEFLAIFRERFIDRRRDGPRLMWQRAVDRGQIRGDVDLELFLDLIYGPMIYRLLVGHGPLDHAEAAAIIKAVFRAVGSESEND